MDAPDASLPLPSPHTATTASMGPSTTFTSTADSTLAAHHLTPGNLPITRITRAWDRKPQSPFSRKKLRFGKVWKRNGNALNHNAPSTIFGGASGIFEAIGAESPVRAVKKMRTDGGELVNAWEGRGSPTNRRIVTRGNHSGEELIALEEEQEQQLAWQAAHEEVLSVEVVNEDGIFEEVDDHDTLAHEEWEDESVADEAREEDVITLRTTKDGPDDTTIPERGVAETTTASPQVLEVHHDEQVEEGVPEPKMKDDAPRKPILLPLQSTTIPEGFVSPAKERRRRPITQVKQANADRRGTLPTNFATQLAAMGTTEGRCEHNMHEQPEPVLKADGKGERAEIEDARAEAETLAEEELQHEVTNGNDSSANDLSQPDAPDGEWEGDVEDDSQSLIAAGDVTPEPAEQLGWVDTVENTPSSEEEAVQDARRFTSQIRERLNALGSPSKLPSSPPATIVGPHPRLPLRRSPRRQPTSPLKNSLRSTEKSHLIVFTPVKMPSCRSTECDAPSRGSPLPGSATAIPAALDNTNLPGITRSSSAPPEEPQMSPEKPKQPRISDDTALLQAFLKRATESKTDLNMSATARRESFENRRNSDSVRRALASPAAHVAPVEVLVDRDPNSPAPLKQNIPAEAEDQKIPSQQEDEIEFDPLSPKRTSRRSGRSKKSSQQAIPTTTYAGPNKITVRGSQEPIVLKKTEAQELAYLTRTNTRKNKGASVLPPFKLTRMAKDGALDDLLVADPVTMDVDQPQRKGVKWAESLVAFYEDGNELEESTTEDEFNAPELVPSTTAAAIQEMASLPAGPTSSETPSKPKLRRLKPPRTASTPRQPLSTPADVPSAHSEQVKETKPKAPSTKRKSRLTTPAKPKDGVTAAFVDLPKEEEPAAKTTAAAYTTERALIPRKRPTSRLPTPGSIAQPLAQGKENSLTASPLKKRAKALAGADAKSPPSANAFAPRLDLRPSADAPEPGISSPAKRIARGNFFAGGVREVEKSATKGLQEMPPSLGSPAKKRSRRVAR
ncbi:hypothetical protein DOTSEDRAFT_52923 [Dothistroma septosporum NZE10]|uniref:Uncharacterized protein n=1 Tax=Dothistroma septosporum (strain NZE10 / CBS 128990) TaxID=675120 RepID=N1PQQ3_DOTSN|nr:hypothetical protein DOTSEDRAFT_52923 [Dothistroma septosporum NZE10]